MKTFNSFAQMVQEANNREKALSDRKIATDVLKYLLDEGYEIQSMKEYNGCLTIELESFVDDLIVDVAYNTLYDIVKWVQVFKFDDEDGWDDITDKYCPDWYDRG